MGWECVCNWLMSHHGHMQNILENMNGESHFSDIGEGPNLEMNLNMSPYTVFVTLMLLLWASLFMYGRSRQTEGKPHNPFGNHDPNNRPSLFWNLGHHHFGFITRKHNFCFLVINVLVGKTINNTIQLQWNITHLGFNNTFWNISNNNNNFWNTIQIGKIIYNVSYSHIYVEIILHIKNIWICR